MDKRIVEARNRHGPGVKILDSFPTPGEISNRKSFLERVVQAVGGQEWMWKTNSGRLIAVIVLPSVVAGVGNFWTNQAHAAIEYAQPYVQMMANFDLPTRPELVVFSVSGKRDDTPNQTPDHRAALIAPRVRIPDQLNSNPSTVEGLSLYRISKFIEYSKNKTLVSALNTSNEEAAKAHLQHSMNPLRNSMHANSRWYSSDKSPGMLYAAADPLVAIDEILRYEELYRNNASLSLNHKYLVYEVIVSGSVEQAPFDFSKPQVDWIATQKFGHAWIDQQRTDMLSIWSDFGADGMFYLLNTSLMRDRIRIGSVYQI